VAYFAAVFVKARRFPSRQAGKIFANVALMKTIIRLIITILPLLCLSAAGPKAQAVVPPPDGGYPNFTTAEGTNALKNLTTGSANTAVGWFSLFSDTEGSFNTATGAGALLFNTAGENTAFGTAALLFDTTGGGNTAVGTAALLNNTEGGNNTACGRVALKTNTTGSTNTATGNGALFSNDNGDDNTANGASALVANISGSGNTAIGSQALFFNTTGSGNIALGESAGDGVSTADNVIAIGVGGENVSGTCYIGNIFGVTSASGTAVFVNSTGKLGTTTSSRRFKEGIKPMERTSEALFGLKPVTFNYKKEIDPAGISQFGLVAEEVEKVNPDLVVRDKEGKAYSVRYDQVNAMLLNEFLKEHRKVEKLEATVADLAAQLQKLSARVEMGSSVVKVAGK
jgi:Chaperone of endosialidase